MILNAVEGKPLPIYGDGLHVRELALRRRSLSRESVSSWNADVRRRIQYWCKLRTQRTCRWSNASATLSTNSPPTRPRAGRKFDPARCRTRQVTTAAMPWKQPKSSRTWLATTHDFDAALRATVQWYLDNPLWVERVTSGNYQRERLGLGRVPC